jgi:hypothetical protein
VPSCRLFEWEKHTKRRKQISILILFCKKKEEKKNVYYKKKTPHNQREFKKKARCGPTSPFSSPTHSSVNKWKNRQKQTFKHPHSNSLVL